MNVIRPESDCLAGILLTYDMLKFYKASWRNRQDVCIEITFENYIKFLADNRRLQRYFSITDSKLIEDFTAKCDGDIIRKLYPCFVRDVIRAYAVEIIYASKTNSEVTKINYVPPTKYYKRVKAENFSDKIELKKAGRTFFFNQENNRNLRHIIINDKPYCDMLDFCMLVIGFTLFIEEKPKKYFWAII